MQIWFLSNGSYSLKNCHNPFGKAIHPPSPPLRQNAGWTPKIITWGFPYRLDRKKSRGWTKQHGCLQCVEWVEWAPIWKLATCNLCCLWFEGLIFGACSVQCAVCSVQCAVCREPLIFIDQADMKETCGRWRRHWQARIHKQPIQSGNHLDGDDDKSSFYWHWCWSFIAFLKRDNRYGQLISNRGKENALYRQMD